MAHGNIYPPEKIDAALTNYFRTGNLTALRELALLWLADKVDEGLQRYRAAHDIQGTWEARERVVVALTGGPEGETLIRRAARIAARSTGGDLLAVHVTRSDGLTGADPAALAAQRRLAESLGGTYHQVVGENIPDALLDLRPRRERHPAGAGRQPPVLAVRAADRARRSACGRSAGPATSTCTSSPTPGWAAAAGLPRPPRRPDAAAAGCWATRWPSSWPRCSRSRWPSLRGRAQPDQRRAGSSWSR